MMLFRKVVAVFAVNAIFTISCKAVMLKGSTNQLSDIYAAASDDDYHTAESSTSDSDCSVNDNLDEYFREREEISQRNFDRKSEEILENMERIRREFEKIRLMKNKLHADNEEMLNSERDASQLVQDDNESSERNPSSSGAATLAGWKPASPVPTSIAPCNENGSPGTTTNEPLLSVNLRVYHLGGTDSSCAKTTISGVNHIFANRYGPKVAGLFHSEVEVKNEETGQWIRFDFGPGPGDPVAGESFNMVFAYRNSDDIAKEAVSSTFTFSHSIPMGKTRMFTDDLLAALKKTTTVEKKDTTAENCDEKDNALPPQNENERQIDVVRVVTTCDSKYRRFHPSRYQALDKVIDQDYNVIRNNCNDFAKAFVKFLQPQGGKKFPYYVNRLARAGRKLLGKRRDEHI